jgi:hypothetical protein
MMDDTLQLTLRYTEKQSGVIVEHSFVLSQVDAGRQQEAARTLLSDLHEVTRLEYKINMYVCIYTSKTEDILSYAQCNAGDLP